MSRKNLYPINELVKRWEREDLTTEQAVGQLLLWLSHLSKRIAKLEAGQHKGEGPRTN